MPAVLQWSDLLRLFAPLVTLATIDASRTEQATPAPQTLDGLLTPLLAGAYGLALRLLRNSADAQDLVQEAALAAARGFGTFQTGTNFKAWFFRILTNCYYSRHRRQRRQGTTADLDEVPDLYLYARAAEAGLHASPADPAQALLNRLDSAQIAGALQSLPQEYRVVSTLYLMEDLSYGEISDILRIPVGTVRSRLHRGRNILKKLLWQVAVEHGLVPDRDREQREHD
ncbi:MAG TPA: sigma-70 family RNA polymerase sigma factor [Gemmatimonadales bacterium]|nr:sigma-70 family RNA polymerase sigma factor [Gemmatimonadales bacterium]